MAIPSEFFTADQLDDVTELVPVGIIRLDPRGGCLRVNARWSMLTGMSAQEAAGDGWQQSIAIEDRERVVRKIYEAGPDAGEFAEEFRIRTPDGRQRTVSCRALPLRASSGDVAGYLATLTDLTERHQTEEALRNLARELGDRIKELRCLMRISHIIEGSGESLPDIMQQTVDLLASSWGHPELAYARIELDGEQYQTAKYRKTPWRHSADIVVDNRRAGTVEVGYLERVPSRGDGPFLAEEEGIVDAVAERLSKTVERLRAQHLLREREQELRERLTRLARINVMGEMAASMAHEVNQPLTAIAAFAQGCRRILEEDGARDPSLLEALKRIATEALRAGEIVHRLDQLARKHRDQRTPCDINHLIRDVCPLAAVDARLHDIRLVLELAPSLPPANADGVQLQQVVLNLIRNAIDAMAQTDAREREVTVRTASSHDGFLEVSVTDRGCGLSGESEARLFEPFFTTKDTGIGMGLAISRSIVTAHGGRLWYTRNPESGTTFRFTIPLAEADP